MGAKFKSKTHLLNRFLDFWRRFLRVGLQSLKKVLIWPKKKFFNQKIKCWFQIRWKSFKKCTKKSYKKVWRTWVKVEKVRISVTFLLITCWQVPGWWRGGGSGVQPAGGVLPGPDRGRPGGPAHPRPQVAAPRHQPSWVHLQSCRLR